MDWQKWINPLQWAKTSTPQIPDDVNGQWVVVNADGTYQPLTESNQKATLEDIVRARTTGVDEDSRSWAPEVYGRQYAQSVPAYRAIYLRAQAVRSAPLQVMRRRTDGDPEPVEDNHPVQELLNRVNPFWSAGDLLESLETYLCLYGSAFWFLDREGSLTGIPKTIWPLRPDRVKIIGGKVNDVQDFQNSDYIVGYEYHAGTMKVSLTTDEVVWFRRFNPLSELAGLSPVAPARATLDMGRNATMYNLSLIHI